MSLNKLILQIYKYQNSFNNKKKNDKIITKI